MTTHHNYKFIVLLGVCICAALGGYIFLINYVWEKAGAISQYKSDIIHSDQKQQYAQVVLESFEGIQGDIDQLKKIFVQKQGEVEFIESIEGLAEENKLSIDINNISIDSPKELSEQGLEYLVVRLSVKGSWDGVWRFSQMLEVLPYSINIQSIALLKEESDVETATSVWKGVYNVKVLKKK